MVERTLRHYKVSHDIIYLFEKTEDMLPFNKRKYKLSTFIRLTANKVYVIESVFRRGSGPSFTWVEFLKTEWRKYIQANCRTIFKTVTDQKVSFVGTVTWHIRVGEFLGRIVFSILRSLVVPDLLEKSTIEIFLNNFFCSERKLVRYIFKPVPVVAINNLTEEPINKDKNAQNMMTAKEELLVFETSKS